MFSVSFDQRSLSEIAQMFGFKAFLTDSMGSAMSKSGDILVQAIRDDMHWKNGDDGEGPLGQSITKITDSPYELQVGSDLPYARRRNWGFDGADSLGRVYHDEGAYFMEHGIDASRQEILSLFDDAAMQAFSHLGGG